MLLKIALLALVFVAVHSQPIGNPEDRVANEPVARPRRGAAEEMMESLNLMGPLGPTNGRQRRSPETAPRDDVEQVSDREAALKRIEEELAKLLAKIEAMPKEEAK